MAKKKDTSDPRTAIAEMLSEYLTPEQCERLKDEILALHKRVHIKFECPYCGRSKSDYVEIPDAKAVVDSLTTLITQGFGRPGEAKDEREMVTIHHYIDFREFDEASDEADS